MDLRRARGDRRIDACDDLLRKLRATAAVRMKIRFQLRRLGQRRRDRIDRRVVV